MTSVPNLSKLIGEVDDTPLDDDDLHDLLKALVDVSAKWKVIGVAFRLKSGKLKEIAASNQTGNPSDYLYEVLVNWVNRNYNTERFGDPTWRRVVEVVADSSAGDNAGLARTIAMDHQRTSAQETNNGKKSPTLLESLTADLDTQLQLLKNVRNRDKLDESKKELIKGALQDFIEKSTQSKIDCKDIKQSLAQIYDSGLFVSKEVYEWALELIPSTPQTKSKFSPDTSDEEQVEEPSLFCEDTVYHASLCNYAVCTRNVNNYKSFFDEEFPNHQFEEASLSVSQDREDVDRYLIARKGKDYFIAFKSELCFSEWQKFESFEQGIQVQTSRIPLRFLIKLLHDGYRIVCTGYSFGGLLAMSVTTSLWKLPLITSSILEKNLCCITISPPLINLPVIMEVIRESPQIKLTLHSILARDDFIPQMTMFLDPGNEEIYSECLLSFEPLSSGNDSFSSHLLHQFAIVQNATGSEADSNSESAEIALTSMKLLLKRTWPHIMSKRFGSGDLLISTVHVIDVDPITGLLWKTLPPGEQPIKDMDAKMIDDLRSNSLFKHNMGYYHEKILRSYIKNLPSASNVQSLPEMATVKPKIHSVSFHCHGKELAITVAGENLWFCNKVMVQTLKQVIQAKDISQRSIQFNCNVEDKLIHFSGVDHVKVKIWSHFLSAPVFKADTEVKHKTYSFTFRQQQLAKLTPSELIETAYLSALLEQCPHNKSQSFSQRFETLRSFLEKVVSVVPFESLIHAMAIAESHSVAIQCCRQLMASNMIPPPSFTMMKSLPFAVNELLIDCSTNPEDLRMRLPHIRDPNLAQKILEKNVDKKLSNLVDKLLRKNYHGNPFQLKYMRNTASVHVASEIRNSCIINEGTINPSSLPIEVLYLMKLHAQLNEEFGIRDDDLVICDFNLEDIYPISSDETKLPLKSPLQILKEGRKKMQLLVTKSAEVEDPQCSKHLTEPNVTRLSQLYNSKMLEIVNEIRKNDLEICTLLLGAFMEEQIRVPLMKTSFDTARAIGIATSAVTLGVWAMFSLSLGDFKAFLTSIPSRSLLVEVKEYIKGVFKQNIISADEKYAGKLQFMVQGLNDTVSCNSHYVSYSLERQLLELCKNLEIDDLTPLETLINDWDKIFKDNVLSLVLASHRSLIARWLKWALMVHHLREELARYTAVGVVGLVNSGKSLLVSTLFDIKIPVGTTATKRTTVPFLYNLDGVVDGLDIIDFPGVDDRDETIPDLAELLLAIAQVVIFVVDYRKAHTESAKKWLEMLEDKSVPVLMCLTYADKLYAEHMGRDGSHPEPKFIKQEIARETEMIVEQLGRVPSRKVQFFSFSQDRDSILNSAEGRKKLEEAGIGTPQGVGDWLADIFENQMDQDELAKKLSNLVHREHL